MNGWPPFFHENESEVLRMVVNDPVVFDKPNLRLMSPNAIDCLQKMLDRDQQKRWSAKMVIFLCFYLLP